MPAALISVVIPAYNRAAVIEAAIRSVQAQTYQDYEILVVDDGSKDGTSAVASRLAQEDSRIKCFQHTENRGAQAARNTGIRAANGRWIAFLDSDDQWLPESLNMRLRVALRSGKEVIHSDCMVQMPESELRSFGTPRLSGRVYKKLLREPGPTFPSLLASKEGLLRIGCLDERIVAYQEWDTAIRLAEHYDFEFISDPTFIYDCRNTDTISKGIGRDAAGYEQVFTKHRWPVVRHLGPKALVSHYQTAAELYRRAQDQQNARRCSNRAVLCWPFQPKAILKRLQRAVSLYP